MFMKQGWALWQLHLPTTNVARFRFRTNGLVCTWIKFVVGSLLCHKRFSSGFSGFPLSTKINTFENFDFRKLAIELSELKIIC